MLVFGDDGADNMGNASWHASDMAGDLLWCACYAVVQSHMEATKIL